MRFMAICKGVDAGRRYERLEVIESPAVVNVSSMKPLDDEADKAYGEAYKKGKDLRKLQHPAVDALLQNERNVAEKTARRKSKKKSKK